MAEGSNVQHIAELGFDITQAKADLQAISDLVEQYSIKISDLAKVDYNPFAALEKSGADLSKVFDVKVFENINKEINAAANSAKGLSDALSKTSETTKSAEESAKVFARELTKTEKELLNLYRQSADIQAQIRKNSMDNTGHAQTAATIREQVEELYKIHQTNGQLNEQERERLAVLMQQSQVLKTEIAVDKSDSIGKASSSLSNFVGQAGKLVGVYSTVQLVNKAFTETYETMRDVETRIMEISRVFDATTEEANRLRDSLFGVAQQMGQTFEGASEISLRFAQAGYHDMAENIELTKTALLAMNTAELDAVNSTNSLVGILKQWNLEASDLITVVDKLNYTADNNAITTQDLVDGLLRASGAAKNAKISFDETVGALVALREATGRTGRELGTALNSLIAFTTRSKSVDVFESLGITVWLDEQQTQMASVLDIWKQLSDLYMDEGERIINVLASQTDMTELYSEEVASLVGATEEYNRVLETSVKLQEELNDAERLDLTSQFGVYRRNYAIALLENFEKIGDVVADMDNSIGHSAKENERYMDTLEAKVNQLKTSLQELAVQAGEAGLLDLAKGAVGATTALTNFTNNVGGLIPVLITLSGVIAIIKRESIARGITSLINPLEKARVQLNLLSKEADQAGGYINAIRNSLKNSESGMASFVGAIGVATTAVTLFVSTLSSIEAAQERTRQKSIDAANAAYQEASAVLSLYDEYVQLSQLYGAVITEDDEYRGLQDQITQALGERAEALEGLTYGTEEYTKALREAISEETKYLQASLESAKQAAATNLEKVGQIGPYGILGERFGFDDAAGWQGAIGIRNFSATLGELGGALDEIIEKYGHMGTLNENTFQQPRGADELIEYYYDLIDARVKLVDLNDEDVYDSEAWKIVERDISAAKDAVEDYLTAAVRAEAVKVLPNTEQELEALRDSLIETYGATAAVTSEIDKILEETFPGLSDGASDISAALSETSDEIDNQVNSYKELQGVISDMQYEITELESVMRALADEKGIDLDMTLNLLDKYPELASAIHFVGNEWYFEADALEALRASKYEMMLQSQRNIALLEIEKAETQELEVELKILYLRFLDATDAAERQAIALEMVGKAAQGAGVDVDELAKKLQQLNLLLAAGEEREPILSPGSSYRGNAESINRGTKSLKSNTSAINEQVKALQAEQKAIDGLYSEAIDKIKELQKADSDASNERIKSLQADQKAVADLYKSRIKNLQDELKEIKASYKAQEQAVKDRYNAEIDALRKLKQEEQREDAREDYERSRAELLAERAEMEKRTSREAVERIAAIDKALEELDRAEERRLRDNAIDDQISSIEDKRDAEIAAIQAAAEAEEERYERRIKNLEKEAEAASEVYDWWIGLVKTAAEIDKKNYQDQIDRLEEQRKQYKNTYDTKIKLLRGETDAAESAAVKQVAASLAVENKNVETAKVSEEELTWMYDSVAKAGHEWTTQAEKDADSLIAKYRQLVSVMNEAYSLKQSLSSSSKSSYKSSHTGSLITGDGLVNLQAGELVVRRDISEGLIRNVQAMEQIQNFVNNATNNNQSYSRSIQIGGISVNGQFEGRRQAQQIGRTAADELEYRLNRMP